MSNLNNQVTLIGRVGNNVGETLRYVNGAAVVQVSLAVPRGGARRDGETEQVDWIRCDFWDRDAETLAQHAKKGSSIQVVGSLRVDRFEKDGVKREKVYIKARQFEFMRNYAPRTQEPALAGS